jgi:hypothetical protein
MASPMDWFEMLLPSLDCDAPVADSEVRNAIAADTQIAPIPNASYESPGPEAVQWSLMDEGSASGGMTGSPARRPDTGLSSGCSGSLFRDHSPEDASFTPPEAVLQAPVGGANVADLSLLNRHSDASTSDVGGWIDRLRQWENELGERAVEAERRSADLEARRREFARLLRQQARTVRRQEDSALTGDLADERFSSLQQQIEALVEYLADARSDTRPRSDGNELAAGVPTLPDSDPYGRNESPYPEESASEADPAEIGRSAIGQTDSDERRLAEIESLYRQIDSLVEQNDQLARELAQHTVRRAVSQSSDAHASLSWEERKALLFKQFEAEDNGEIPVYETEVDQAATDKAASEEVARLREENARLKGELKAREREIGEMRTLLENRPVVAGGDLAVGAASIAMLLDGDELVQCERDRLKEIQEEWEAKFRDLEIASSIERAGLARQRRELEARNAELEEQLVHLQREIKQDAIAGPNQPSRWLAKLGLKE